MENAPDFLGTGWAFPPTFENCRTRMVSGLDDICESLRILLDTRLGERVMQLRYGVQLDELLFEALNTTLITRMKQDLQTAILLYEPRIELEQIRFDLEQQLEGLLRIELIYLVLATNSRFNFVYPFYILEGTNIETIEPRLLNAGL